MTIAVTEKVESRATTVGDSSSVELLFTLIGSEDDEEIRDALEAAAPDTHAGVLRQGYDVRHLGGGVWEAAVQYAPRDPDESQYSFDISAETLHITQSLATTNSYTVSGTAPNTRGAIGIDGENVQGCDIDAPTYDWSETHHLAASAVDGAYKATLFAIRAAPINNASFRGFAAGEVKFLGASGSKNGRGKWEITYRFSAQPNVTGIVHGDITGIAKKGWEYLWTLYESRVDQNRIVKRPVAVYVEQVYRSSNFAGLGIGTS